MKAKDWINLSVLLFAASVLGCSIYRYIIFGIAQYLIPASAMGIMIVLTLILWVYERKIDKNGH